MMKIAVFKKKSQPYFRLFFAAMTAVMVTGCTTVHKDFKAFSPAPGKGSKASAKVAVLLPQELCSWYYKPRDFQEFSLGPVVCNNARIAARAAFSEPLFFSSENDMKSAQYDFVGIVRPRKVWLYGSKTIPATVTAGASLFWEFRSGDGKRLYGATLFGNGEDQRTFGVADIRYERQHAEMHGYSREKPIRPDGGGGGTGKQQCCQHPAVSGRRWPPTGREAPLTPSTRDGKDDEWHIFALEETAKYEDRGYGYISDPESGRHASIIGAKKPNGAVACRL